MTSMDFPNGISFVMVAYNEERHIEAILRNFYEKAYSILDCDKEFIIYLDGPSDGTADIVNGLRDELGLTVIDVKENKGYFRAAKAALSHASKEWVFFSDSSGKHVPEDLERLYEKTGDADIVTGLRAKRQDTLYRQLLSICQRFFVSAIFLMPLYDFNTGFKLIRKKVLDDLLSSCSVLPVTFSTELVIRAHKGGYRVVNAPVTFLHRGAKEKQFAPKKLPKVISSQLAAYLRLWKELML